MGQIITKFITKISLGLLFPLLVLISQAFATCDKSHDLLGLPKYCDAAVEFYKSLPEPRGVGFFTREFGDAKPCLVKLLNTGKVCLWRAHTTWDKTHGYPSSKFADSAKEAARFNDVAKQFPAVPGFITGATEHLLDSANSLRLASLIRPAAPNLTYINNPLIFANGSKAKQGAFLPGMLNEVHGFDPRIPGTGFFISADGTSSLDMNLSSWFKNYAAAQTKFVWGPLENCRQQGTTANPKDRKVCASVDYFRMLEALFEEPGAPPAFPFQVERLGNRELYKLAAEDKVGNSDPRANRPMSITQMSISKPIRVMDSKGKEIASFKNYGPYTERGLYRHYSGTGSKLYGYELTILSKRSSGNGWVALKLLKMASKKDPRTGKVVQFEQAYYKGPIWPSRRQGYYR